MSCSGYLASTKLLKLKLQYLRHTMELVEQIKRRRRPSGWFIMYVESSVADSDQSRSELVCQIRIPANNSTPDPTIKANKC